MEAFNPIVLSRHKVTFASIRDEVINEYVIEGLHQQGMVDQPLLSCSCHGSMETCVFLPLS